MICNDGTSDEPNEIVICDVCNQGYHQKCHKPRVANSILEPNVPWSCRLCVFALGTKEGGTEKVKSKAGEKVMQMKACLSYDIGQLQWDDLHQTNRQNTYCYCGGSGEFYSKMLQCQKCSQWFHEACLQCLETPLLYGDHYYNFCCAVCNKGKEFVRRIIMKWGDCVSLVLHNLTLQHGKRFFDLKTEIVPFAKNNCHMIKLSEDLNNLSKEELFDKITSILTNNPTKFKSGKEVKQRVNTWAIRPMSGPFIFAPPNAITATMSSPESLSPPPALGACRKGAAIVPLSKERTVLETPKTKSKTFKVRSLQEMKLMGRSNSLTSLVSSGTSSISSSNKSSTTCSKVQASSGCKKEPVEPKVVVVVKKKRKPVFMRKRTSAMSHDAAFHSLAAVIPFPANFEGKNNPFCDVDEDTCETKSKKRHCLPPLELGSHVQEEFIVKSNADSPSKLTIQRVSLSPSYSKEDQARSQLLNSSSKKCNSKDDYEDYDKSDQGFVAAENANDYKVLARRVARDGKVEYLLEWDNATGT